MTTIHSDIIILLVTLILPNLMTVSYYNRTQQRYRITLDITVEDEFNPRQIDWRKVLQLEPNESVESVTEDLSDHLSWL